MTFWRKNAARGKVTKEVLFLHDNALTHRALATKKILVYVGFQFLGIAPYSMELAPSDCHLFPGLKKNYWKVAIFRLTRVHCCRGDLVRWTTFLMFLSGLQKLEQRAKKCIEPRGEYVE
jgi:histone-lysine N-methyltransferase SETMAR